MTVDTGGEHTLSDLSTEGNPGWRAFSDQVMGGISREQATLTTIAGRRCARLQGEVRLTQPLDQGSLTRLGVVAYGRRFVADVAVARVVLYR